MKWTTANVKHPNYTVPHELFVGTHTGCFKRESIVAVLGPNICYLMHFTDLVPASEKTPHGQRNLCDLGALDKESRVTALHFGNDAHTEVLVGRSKGAAELHSLGSKEGSRSCQRTVSFGCSPIVGLAWYNDKLVAGLANGQIQSLELWPNAARDPVALVSSAATHIDHLRQCANAKSVMAIGGKERQNGLKVFDLSADCRQIFASKNLPNDHLQLEVPVWDSDIGFVDGPHVLATCSRTGYVRLYDTRKQRRPVACFSSEEHGMSFAALVARGNHIYTGTTMGVLKAFDMRRMKTHVHTYKGFTGGISDLQLDDTGRFLASASLDRYVRVHDSDSTVLLYQCYVKSKATKILIRRETDEAQSGDCDPVPDTNDTPLQKESVSPSVVDNEYENLFEMMPVVGWVF
ncbi:hypothetical protein KR018_003467 [Drosophila ironensis]|nr:hypothetical protein KR018_003467 [Drosophila ironensis]